MKRLLTGLGLCLLVSSWPALVTAEERILTSLHTPAGEHAQFSAVLDERGETVGILLEMHGPATPENTMAFSRAGELPTEVYERYTGQAAPDALVEAERRALEALEQASTPEEASAPEQGQDDQLDAAEGDMSSLEMSGNQFEQWYCLPRQGGANFYWCLLNRTGGGSTITNASHIYTAASPYRGTISLSLDYEVCTSRVFGICVSHGWRAWRYTTILENSVAAFEAWGNFKYRTTVGEATGDGYHRAVIGHR